MAKFTFLNQAESFISGSYISQLRMVIQIRKPENKGTI